jgi:hypothetical protein
MSVHNCLHHGKGAPHRGRISKGAIKKTTVRSERGSFFDQSNYKGYAKKDAIHFLCRGKKKQKCNFRKPAQGANLHDFKSSVYYTLSSFDKHRFKSGAYYNKARKRAHGVLYYNFDRRNNARMIRGAYGKEKRGATS